MIIKVLFILHNFLDILLADRYEESRIYCYADSFLRSFLPRHGIIASPVLFCKSNHIWNLSINSARANVLKGTNSRKVSKFLKLLFELKTDKKIQFIDVGSNICMFTSMAKEYNLNCIAFEPNPILYNATNKLFNVKNFAVSNSSGYATLTVPQKSTGMGTIDKARQESFSAANIKIGSSYQVETVQLCDFVDEINPSILKIDVEGHESEVFDGLGTKIRFLDAIVFETSLSYNSKLISHILDNDFCFISYKKGRWISEFSREKAFRNAAKSNDLFAIRCGGAFGFLVS